MAKPGRKPETLTAAQLAELFNQALAFVQQLHGKFLVPPEALADQPEREEMVKYLRARAWRGNEAGACYSAGISLVDLERWREIEEFTRLEALADKACTDILEESAVFHALLGDKDMLKSVLKARSEKFGDRQEVTGKGGGPVEFTIRLDGIPRPQRLKLDGTESESAG